MNEKGAKRDKAVAAYRLYEFSMAVLTLGIVLPSALIVTGVVWPTIVSHGLGAIGALIALRNWLALTAFHP